MDRKPTVAEIQSYLDERDPLRLRGAAVTAVAERNHLIYRITKGRRSYALRMINPESYRRTEWISMAREFDILRVIEPTGLGPKAYMFIPDFVDPPFQTGALIHEFITATCFNDLKPLADEHFVAAAQAIATLNVMDISPVRFPFMRRYVRKDYAGSGVVWYYRLFDSLRRMPRRDVARWVFKILPLIPKTMAVLSRSILLLPQRLTFHLDGAHCGNTYWRDGRAMFLDWQKVSLRNDPTFTLVRFATSVGEKSEVPEQMFDALVGAYLEVRSIVGFRDMARVRLLERQTADLVWVLWDTTRRRDPLPVEMVQRYAEVRRMLQAY